MLFHDLLKNKRKQKLSIYPQQFQGRSIDYPDFITRISALFIDLSLVYFFLNILIFFLVSKIIYLLFGEPPAIFQTFANDLSSHNGEIKNIDNTVFIEQLSNYLYNQHGLLKEFARIFISIGIINFIIFKFYNKYQTSPGKYLLRLQILDEKTYNLPTAQQYFLRVFVGYTVSIMFFFIPVILSVFNLRRRNFNDYVGKTVVVRLGKKGNNK